MLLKLRAIFWLATTSPGGMAKFPCEASSRHPGIATSWFLLPLTVLSPIVLPLWITLPSPHKYPPFLLLTEDWSLPRCDIQRKKKEKKKLVLRVRRCSTSFGIYNFVGSALPLCLNLANCMYIAGNGFSNLYSPFRIWKAVILWATEYPSGLTFGA